MDAINYDVRVALNDAPVDQEIEAPDRCKPAAQNDHDAKQQYQLPFLDVAYDLDTYWRQIFSAAKVAYRSPSIRTLTEAVTTACGPAGPEHLAFYCPAEETIYYAPAWLDDHGQRIGDFAPVVVLAHEWAHHVQTLMGISPTPGSAFELQADCLAGAYASDAAQRGILDPGDITEAVILAASVGDPLGLPQDAPGAHGINDDRISAFMRGYLQGDAICAHSLARAKTKDGN